MRLFQNLAAARILSDVSPKAAKTARCPAFRPSRTRQGVETKRTARSRVANDSGGAEFRAEQGAEAWLVTEKNRSVGAGWTIRFQLLASSTSILVRLLRFPPP